MDFYNEWLSPSVCAGVCEERMCDVSLSRVSILINNQKGTLGLQLLYWNENVCEVSTTVLQAEDQKTKRKAWCGFHPLTAGFWHLCSLSQRSGGKLIASTPFTVIYCFLENRSRDITHISIPLTKENPERQTWPLIVSWTCPQPSTESWCWKPSQNDLICSVAQETFPDAKDVLLLPDLVPTRDPFDDLICMSPLPWNNISNKYAVLSLFSISAQAQEHVHFGILHGLHVEREQTDWGLPRPCGYRPWETCTPVTCLPWVFKGKSHHLSLKGLLVFSNCNYGKYM